MSALPHIVLALLWLPAAGCCLYLLVLTPLSGKPAAPARSSRRLRFDLIVPAHDEAPVIARTVESLLALDWPRDQFRIFVVADNCTDATAALAREAGAYVIERNSADLRGKGYALQYAFRASQEADWADAVVVVDADSVVSGNLLEAFAARIEAGADAVQAHYGVLNPDASWRTRLMTVAKTCFHVVRSRGRERLRLSCGLRGNGWCVTRHLLTEIPYAAFTLAEDVEYGITLGLVGYRVHYADEAHVLGEMVTVERAARTQRRRWEDGRKLLQRSQTGPLIRTAWKYSDAACLDLALDLLLPPLTTVGVAIVLLTAVTLPVAAFVPGLGLWSLPALFCCLCLGLHVVRGWQLSGLGAQGGLALAQAPRFAAWKLMLALKPRSNGEWIRTEREQPVGKVVP